MTTPLIEERYASLVAERRKRVCPALIMTDAEKEIVAKSYFPDFDFTGMTQEEYADTIDNFTWAHERQIGNYYEDDDFNCDGLEKELTFFQKDRCTLCRLWDEDDMYECDSCFRTFCGKCSDALETVVGYGDWGDYCVDCDEQRWTTAEQKADIMDTKNREYKEERNILASQRAIRQAELDLC